VILGALYLGWYRWPGWYLAGVLRVVGIMVLVDVLLGPTLTLIIANPKKPLRELVRDIAIIATVQLAALVYGTATLWMGRPLYYTYSADRLEFVQASDIDAAEARRATQENPALAPHWYSLPRWVWAPLPDDPAEALKIVQGATLGQGGDVIDMPRYFRPWDQGLAKLRGELRPIADIRYLSKGEKARLRGTMTARSLDPDARNALIMWGEGRRLVAIFDPDTLAIRALLIPD